MELCSPPQLLHPHLMYSYYSLALARSSGQTVPLVEEVLDPDAVDPVCTDFPARSSTLLPVPCPLSLPHPLLIHLRLSDHLVHHLVHELLHSVIPEAKSYNSICTHISTSNLHERDCMMYSLLATRTAASVRMAEWSKAPDSRAILPAVAVLLCLLVF